MKKLLFILLFVFLKNSSFADDKMKLGLEVFNNKAQCSACHTLKASGSNSQIGPNLDQIKPTTNKVIYTITNGIGVMPSFKDILTLEEIEVVAHYVFNSTNN